MAKNWTCESFEPPSIDYYLRVAVRDFSVEFGRLPSVIRVPLWRTNEIGADMKESPNISGIPIEFSVTCDLIELS